MASLNLAPIGVRTSRIALLLAPALVLALLAGCSHRRSAMRPVYGTPVGTAVGCPTVTSPAAPGGTIITQPDSGAEPVLTPIQPPSTGSTDGVSRTGGSPPVPAEPEPTLSNPQPSNPGASSNGAGGIELTKPNALRSTGRKASAPARSASVSLRNAVIPYVADPNDLFQPPKADRPWKYVVVHHSANAQGGLDQIDRDHRKVLGFEGCGYHFVIGNGTDSPDGQIEVADRWLNQKHGVHCRNGKTPDVNEYGIGICLVGNFDQSEPTPKQVAAAKALVAYLGDRYKIANDKVGTHDQFADGPTACPGKNFPSEAIFGSKHMAAR